MGGSHQEDQPSSSGFTLEVAPEVVVEVSLLEVTVEDVFVLLVFEEPGVVSIITLYFSQNSLGLPIE